MFAVNPDHALNRQGCVAAHEATAGTEEYLVLGNLLRNTDPFFKPLGLQRTTLQEIYFVGTFCRSVDSEFDVNGILVRFFKGLEQCLHALGKVCFGQQMFECQQPDILCRLAAFTQPVYGFMVGDAGAANIQVNSFLNQAEK